MNEGSKYQAQLFSFKGTQSPFLATTIRDGIYRYSYWNFYDGGGSLQNLVDFISTVPHRPYALLLNLIHSVLLSLQWLNSFDLHHLDAHLGNIFLRWDEKGQLYPIVGDFELARFAPPLEAPFNAPETLSPNFSHDGDIARNLSSCPPNLVITLPESAYHWTLSCS